MEFKQTYKFSYSDSEGTKIEFEVNPQLGDGIYNLVEKFADYLKACGFSSELVAEVLQIVE